MGEMYNICLTTNILGKGWVFDASQSIITK